MVEQKFRWCCFRPVPSRYSGKPSVKLTFLNRDIAFEGLLNGVDQLGATATGEVMIRGRIPLMDKIGYVSRIALREVPKPAL